ncbi:protease complex subunit PrcB family protein [Patescibacteria group bacterium]|nr:protease complex subunit PrcB family protein [Patescibacteria group bacterium]MBU4142304.1 protease complex subunit PrcB family protein [Patescibacteria group bacterium]
MQQQKISPARIFLLLSIIISVSAALGFMLAAGKIGKINLPVVTNPAEKGITISTDKTEYEQEETVKIIIKNNSKKEFAIYQRYGGSFSFMVEKMNNGEWKEIINTEECSCGAVCEAPQYIILESGEMIDDGWDQKEIICDSLNNPISKQAIPGKYRIKIILNPLYKSKNLKTIYSNEFTIKEKTAADPKCGQKAKVSEVCSKVGYEFDSSERECVIVNGAGCIDSLPFSSFEECQKTCESSTVSGNELRFKTIIKGLNGNPTGQGNYVIKSKSEWMPILQKINAELPAPIDFDKDMIIAVFQGEKSTGGYNTEINTIAEKGNTIEVSVLENSPGRGCAVTQALTSPFHIVKVQKSDKKVLFNIEKVINDCK